MSHFRLSIAATAMTAVVITAVSGSAVAQPGPDSTVAGPFHVTPMDATSMEIDRIHPQTVATARSLGLNVRGAAGILEQLDRNTAQTLNWPMRIKRAAPGASQFFISNFVDLDTTTALRDFSCAQRTYDGHRGIDIGLGVFGWWRMDNNETEIVAAAPGTIVNKQDGQTDRTCGTLANVPSNPANFVIVQQDDGASAYYWHMKNGSVTAKGIGERVQTGERLGLVGSSGRSTGPHLHFELRDEFNVALDPFAGTCGATRSLWKHQWHAEADFRTTEVATFDGTYAFASNCTNNHQVDTDTINYRNAFSPGEVVYGILFLRDQSPGQRGLFEFFDPAGNLVATSQTGTPPAGSFYSISWWTFGIAIPNNAVSGAWRLRGSTGPGNVLEHTFFVGPAPSATSVVGAVLPGGRSVRNGSPATVFATILNASSQPARGCTIQPYTPLNASFTFQTTNPTTNAVTGQPNRAVDIPANASQSFVLAFTPSATSRVAEAVTAVLHMKCANADAAPVFDGVNTLLLSFDPNAVPDIIPIAATVSNDGVVRIPGPAGSAAWTAAAVNIGLNATLNVSTELGVPMPLTVNLCESNPSTGACLSAPAASVSTAFAPNSPKTFSIFVTASGNVAFAPATARIKLNFKDAAGIIRGQTSVAVTTN